MDGSIRLVSTDTSKPIGFIGLGIMGKPMVRNLSKAGFSLVVHTRTRSSADELAAEIPGSARR